ncbi:MAG: PhoH family protein [Candidatus Saccharicenans sp.]|jgi:phosphate starvation-inducible PhoH-like protein|nr:PhoH family protein [Candidatus Saccharicenans sp.]
MEKVTRHFLQGVSYSGSLEKSLKRLESRLGLNLSLRGDKLIIEGSPEKVQLARKFFDRLQELENQGYHLREEDFQIALDFMEENHGQLEDYAPAEPLCLQRKSVAPKSLNQKNYMEAIKDYDLVFGIGPAGTGKTYLAMALALSYLQGKQVSRIILTRPAVEAGEKLGFLPGDMFQKVNPYLRPLYDALFDLTSYEQANRLIEKGVIEIAPLAYMRGRTLNNAFVILDEAQNTSREQMKMILTRLGFDSKLVVTADITQIDLPQPRNSGVLQAIKVLSSIKEIAFVYFTEKDVVRHPLVARIIKAYARSEAQSL